LVVTCAGVVALRPAAEAPSRVYADFPAAGGPGGRLLPAEVLADPHGVDGGVTVLRLTEPAPARPVLLHRQSPAPHEPVRLVGYPGDRPDGREVPARLLERDGPGVRPAWVRIAPDAGSGPLGPGFAGGGVVHGRTGRVIGILAQPPGGSGDGGTHRMIPTETLLRHLPEAGRDRLVSGHRAVSRTIPPTSGPPDSRRARGLRHTVTAWLDGGTAPGPGRVRDPVELAFAGDDDQDALSVLHATLNLADRERAPGTGEGTRAPVPQAGSIDLAVEVSGRTVAELVAHTAGRTGLDDGAPGGDGAEPGADGRGPARATEGPAPGRDSSGTEADGPAPPTAGTETDALLERIAGHSPPLCAAFLSVDRAAPVGEAVLPLLHALLRQGHSRLLLTFRDPRSPLLDRVAGELLDPGWSERRARTIAERLDVLTSLERRSRPPGDRADRAAGRGPAGAARRSAGGSADGGGADRHTVRLTPPASRHLAARLSALRGGGLRNSAALSYELFRLHSEVEEAVHSFDPDAAHRYTVLPAGDGLTDLPQVTVDNPDDLVDTSPDPAAPDSGLTRGQELHQQYRVIGRIGQGSFGRVYLARDQMLENRAVALKGVRDPGDPGAAETALRERLRLIGLNHPSIIKVFNYARHPGHPQNTAMFIVMEFADGAPLQWVADQIRDRVPPFHDDRVPEFITVYGLLILNALTHLHEKRRLVYGDLSLTNVIHCGGGIKLIDVAGVREIGAPGPVTYPAPELRYSNRMTVAADLYAVGAVLRQLFDLAPKAPSPRRPDSLERAVARAMADLPEARFASAAEMALQLRGVLRELRSLRLGKEHFEPSPLFIPTPAALDGELGRAPALVQWRTGGNAKRRLTFRPPEPSAVACGLPVPKPDENDRNWTMLQRTSYDDPVGLLQLSGAWDESPERSLLRCRLHLDIAGHRPEESAQRCAEAERELARARSAIGALAGHDWRLHWHQGLLRLFRGDLAGALTSFDRVYAAIPGEYAPKLALGYCHERLDRPKTAETLYQAVWQRNRALGGAAFGLARIHLLAGRAADALTCLRAVPADSRHRTAARTAVVRILADPPADGSPPSPEEACRAWVALHRLTRREGLTDQLAEQRLGADLLELLLLLVPAAGPRPRARTAAGRRARPPGDRRDPGGGDPLETLRAHLAELPEDVPAPASERELREQLAACYLRLYEQVPPGSGDEDRALAEALVDNAYLTRPFGFRHRRSDEAPRGLFDRRARGRSAGG
ncbi:tetratricopeptide repeat protein, partial [Streptomyces clavuligerus]